MHCHEITSPLHIAATFGLTSAVQLLIYYGAKINNKNKSGFTPVPLELASMNGHTQIIKILLDHGAKVSRKSLRLAKNEGIKQLLIEHRERIKMEAKTALKMPKKDNCVIQ